MNDLRRASLAVGATAAAAAFVYAVAIEPFAIETVDIEIFLPRLPIEFDGYTVLQLSDLHTSRYGKREQIVADLIKSLPIPDLVVITGDLVHTSKGIPPFLRVTDGVKGRDGIFAVFGNSEHKNGIRPAAFSKLLSDSGIQPLLNSHCLIARGGKQIALVGVDDPVSLRDCMEDGLEGLDDSIFKVLLMHSPDGIAEAVVRGIDLTLSGHTHGGQVKFPLFGAPYTHSTLGRRMSNGYYAGSNLKRIIGIRPGRSQLYVTRGLGVSGVALRFLCRPELTRITLRKGVPRAKIGEKILQYRSLV